ncbi:Tetratricopeptide repeat protein [Rubripirellula tenax]|uniref:Tetratricopeptide repeat protein n=2 Tax=Rubripirellula tenax TaxID=2528015 RepID=A0A5C6FAC3_9BACT|nr:Tetratricopeptide repeat protein [Rubripirellula tenax]
MLALLGLSADRLTTDPYVGFSSTMPLMVETADDVGTTTMVTSPTKLRWFNSQSFAVPKPDHVKRVFCVGGSTTFGRPFDDATSYCGYLRRLLPYVDPATQWEVINAGGVSYASYRVAAVMEELASYEPDLFIVYSAHNEFLERRTYPTMYESSATQRWAETSLRKTRTFTAMESIVRRLRGQDDAPIEMLPGDVDERLNHTPGPVDYVRDDTWSADVVRHYRLNLERMITIARRSGAAIVLVEPSSNQKDCSPFKSDDQHFDRGRGLFEQGLFDEALAEFTAAVDRDICPLRATSAIIESVHSTAAEQDVALVRFDERLRAKCFAEYGHACLGNEYFLDHVHPTIDVHRDLACWIIETLEASKWLRGTIPDGETVARVDTEIRNSIDRDRQAIAFRNLAKVLHWSGKFTEARRSAEDALRLMPGDLESQFVRADCFTRQGLFREAIEQYESIFEAAEYEKAMLPFAYLLADTARLEQAEFYATLATASESPKTRTAAFELLVRIHTALDEPERAAEANVSIDESTNE